VRQAEVDGGQLPGVTTAEQQRIAELGRLNRYQVERHAGRLVAVAEAIYSYEGTREMNMLIVGRAITGMSACV
jgi:alkylation response protein AidB-like acyl-CoA dehydrogenase